MANLMTFKVFFSLYVDECGHCIPKKLDSRYKFHDFVLSCTGGRILEFEPVMCQEILSLCAIFGGFPLKVCVFMRKHVMLRLLGIL